MNPTQIIARKRDGQTLSADEIRELVQGYACGAIADYQMAAWAMAVYQRGMTPDETVALTAEMLASGESLSGIDPSPRVDKHSTGGIGDKTSFIIAPLLACCGLQVPMISGRGLGPTGGTLDKLESIPGLRVDLSREEIDEIAARVGCVIAGTTADLVPADRKLYALRDVTATVGSIPLITASILSKKLAERLSALVLDVKFGSGTFMKTRRRACELAHSLVEVGTRLGLPTAALLTAMNQPLGRMVGNAVEVDEALDVLKGGGPDDVRELAVSLAAEVLAMKNVADDSPGARDLLHKHLDSGEAYEKFSQMAAAQGGNLDAPRPRAAIHTVVARTDGYIVRIDGERMGLSVVEMGGGRKQITDTIDPSIGLEVLVKIGDRVARDQPLVNVFAPPAARASGLTWLERSIEIGHEAPALEPLVAQRIGRAPAAAPSQRAESRGATPEERQKLMDAALSAQKRAHAPYSGFPVGAAVLAASGRIYPGANVENASYGLTICAERAALVAAVSAGEKEFLMLAVATLGGAAPCGACRQFAAEFCRDFPILLVDSRRPAEVAEWLLADLLPARFEMERP